MSILPTGHGDFEAYFNILKLKDEDSVYDFREGRCSVLLVNVVYQRHTREESEGR